MLSRTIPSDTGVASHCATMARMCHVSLEVATSRCHISGTKICPINLHVSTIRYRNKTKEMRGGRRSSRLRLFWTVVSVAFVQQTMKGTDTLMVPSNERQQVTIDAMAGMVNLSEFGDDIQIDI